MSSTPEPEPTPAPHDGPAAAQTPSEAEQTPSATGEQAPSAAAQTPSEAGQMPPATEQTPSATERTPAPSPTVRPAAPRPAAKLIFDDPLNQQSSDDTDRGWGERPAGGDSAADLARFLDEKPPHHL
ncbi:hypothetical protein ACFWJW_21455 [Streptomyces sp. NPDC127097]|uniref:hypothetical protein n=1 Tax=Streptomyces sp. NPDC127097 TaxID=3347136 RepID=UPI003665B75A